MQSLSSEYVCAYDSVRENKFISGLTPRVEPDSNIPKINGVDLSDVVKLLYIYTDELELCVINQLLHSYICGDVDLVWEISVVLVKKDSVPDSFFTYSGYAAKLIIRVSTDGMCFSGDISVLYATHLEYQHKSFSLTNIDDTVFTVDLLIPIEFFIILVKGSNEQRELCLTSMIVELNDNVEMVKYLKYLGYSKLEIVRTDYSWKV